MGIIILTGPTCSGKTTIENLLAERGFGKVVSHTTRAPRVGEVDGKSYYFVDEDFFTTHRDDFIESVCFDGHSYGVHASEITRLRSAGFRHIVIVAEPNGVRQISQWCDKSNLGCDILILTASKQELFTRFLLRGRADGFADVAKHAKRLATMCEEVDYFSTNALNGWGRLSTTGLTPEAIANIIYSSVQFGGEKRHGVKT